MYSTQKIKHTPYQAPKIQLTHLAWSQLLK